jgi:hypothetical protein
MVMARTQKLVDLIHIDRALPESQLVKEYHSRLTVWYEWLQQRQDEDLRTFDSYVEEQAEYYTIENCLKNFLAKRLEWIQTSVRNADLRYRYLLVLPPFNQKGSIKRFLLHFFQLNDGANGQQAVFGFLNKPERELRVLWDMYKLTRTLETIATLQKAVKGSSLFPSLFSAQHVQSTLNNLEAGLTLLFRLCIKPAHQDILLDRFGSEMFSPDAALERRETGNYLVNDSVLEKLDYRQYLFYIYYRPSMKALYQGQEHSYQINYLDFEIMRQEFLIHWINQRLKNNPHKMKVLDRYRLGQKTFAQIIEKRPELEISLLKQLPKDVFDDIIAHVNESVPTTMKAPVDPQSENWGDFARVLMQFEKVRDLARKSVDAVRGLLRGSKTVPIQAPKVVQPMVTPQIQPSEPLPSQYQTSLVRDGEISFPFFSSNNAHFLRLHSLFKIKIETKRYLDFNRKIEMLLNQLPDDQIVKRRSPRNERSAVYLLDEITADQTIRHLLILGAELKNRPASVATPAGAQPRYDYRSYFVYGTAEKRNELGFIAEERKVRGVPFYIYDFSHPGAIRQALALAETIWQQHGIE